MNFETQNYRICGVCGDKALGYNFNALTCESCKAFFRRNALRYENYRCTTGGDCQITIQTRKYCRHCRLKKCFKIGMCKDWILGDKDKKFHIHRKHRHHNVRPDSSSLQQIEANQNVPTNGKSKNFIILPIIIEKNIKSKNNSFYNELIDFINEKLSTNINTNNNNQINDGSSTNHSNNEKDKRHLSNVNDDRNFSNKYISDSNENVKVIQTVFNSNGNNKDINLNFNEILNGGNRIHLTNDDFNKNNVCQIECSNINNSIYINDNIDQKHNFDHVQRKQQQQEKYDKINDDFVQMNGHEMFLKNVRSNIENCSTNNKMNNDNWNIPDIVYRHAIQLEHTTNPLSMFDSKSYNKINNEDADCYFIDNFNDEQMFELNTLEKRKLDEVNHYLITLYDLGDNPENQKVIRHIKDGFKYLEMSMKNLIITVKNVPAFKQLCQEDQIQLLKSGAIEIKWIINLKFFDETSQSCLLPNPDVEERNSYIVFDNDYLIQTYGEEIMTRLKNLFSTFRYDWRNDNSILNLLSMMILFYPGRPNLIDREYIRLQFCIYSHLLRKYLQVKYLSICEGRSCYLKLISGVQEIRYLNEQFLDLMLKFDMKLAGPLTLELYDFDHLKKSLKLI